MKVGDKITFTFAKKEKQGTLVTVNDKKVVIKADFENHKGKLITRKKYELDKKPAATTKVAKTAKPKAKTTTTRKPKTEK